MTAEDNKSNTRNLFDQLFNQGNPSKVDEMIAPDYVDHSALPPPAPGPDGFKMRARMLSSAFSPKMTFGPFLAEGDLIAFTWSMKGTHQGKFAGAEPTGAEISIDGINIERFQDGKIVEHWSQFDLAGLLRQIGLLPSGMQSKS
jgi:predicted ester cyclase